MHRLLDQQTHGITVRAPLRISFAGGGTDLRAFWERDTGCVISTAIKPGLTVRLELGDEGVRVEGCMPEAAPTIDGISNRLIAETLRWFGVESRARVAVSCAVRPGSGLGTSSALVCALTQALSILVEGRELGVPELAELASFIEIERVGRPIGKQDHYASAAGGLNLFEFLPDGRVKAVPVRCGGELKRKLQECMLLFDTGVYRDAGKVLAETGMSPGMSDEKRRRLTKIRDAAYRFKECLEGRDLAASGAILLDAWYQKRGLAQGVSVPLFDALLERGLADGAYGGKLLGAGSGGHALILAPRTARSGIIASTALRAVPIELVEQGVSVERHKESRRLHKAQVS